MRLPLLAIALGACASEPHDYGGHFHIELARDDANHSAVVEFELHQPTEVAFALVGDDPRATTGYTDDGYFTFTTYRDNYRLLVTVDGREIEYQHHVKFLEIVNRQAGRRHPTPVTLDATQIQFDAPPPSPALASGSTVIVASTGVWTATDTQQANVATTVPWRSATPVDSELGLLGADDRVYLYALEPCTACSLPYRSLTRVLDASIVQSDGATSMVTGALREPAERSDVILPLLGRGELVRIGGAFSGAQPVSTTWGIDSIPAPSLGPLGRLPLVVGGPLEYEVSVAVVVHNVFPGTSTAAWFEATFVRDLGGIPLVFGTRHVVLLEQDRFDLDELIGVPTQPEIALGDGDPLVTWELAVGGDGPIDDYVLTLFDVTATGLLPVRTIITDHASALIDRTLLVPGHVYIVRLDARLGVPGASDGFFLTTQYPFATATTWSAAFTAR